MPIRVSNIRLGIDEPELALPARVAGALDVRPAEISRWRILRKSLDARDKSALAFVYSVEVALPADEQQLVARAARKRSTLEVGLYSEPTFDEPRPGSEPLEQQPVVVGAGPAGLFAAFFLAQYGYRPIVLERGRSVRERVRDVQAFDEGGPHDPESNYLFGEGGAGTFSDGKLTCRASGPDVRRVLEILAESKGKPSIVYDHRPHLGSNRLPAVVKALRQRIEQMGGEFRFSCRVEDLDLADGQVRGLATSSGHMPTSVVVLAIGHSARDTYEMLVARGVPLEQKPFQLGLRIEQPQEHVNRAQYGAARLEERLGAADYSLVARGEHNVFTFCMCAGGYVMPAVSEPGCFATNGMSLSKRNSRFANSGLMVTLEPAFFGSSHVLAGVHLQRVFEQRAYELGRGEYLCPIQRVDDFLGRRPTKDRPASSYLRGLIPGDVSPLMPELVARAMYHALPILDRRWRGRFLAEATLVGPESRGSSPVRFPRDAATYESTGAAGLYPIGEGAGYAGGIVSAALDGLRAARAIINRFAPIEPSRA
ncbi:MAG: NAD(P)-binding protein [Pirellulales bacterium]|nr:NAD(P)-binding protein [Pirellulales bacterium]